MLNLRASAAAEGAAAAEAIDCNKCKKSIPSGIFFCPYCGSVILQNMLMKNSSTANYDSSSAMNLRPWKDPPPFKPPVSKDNNNSKMRKKKVPEDSDEKPRWTPVMKQSQSLKKKKKAKTQEKEVAVLPMEPPAAVELLSSDVIIIDGQAYMKLQPVNINTLSGKSGNKSHDNALNEAIRSGALSGKSHMSEVPSEVPHDDESVVSGKRFMSSEVDGILLFPSHSLPYCHQINVL